MTKRSGWRRWCALLVLPLVTLAGCIKVDMKFNVSTNATVDVEIIQAFNGQLLTTLGMDVDDMLAEIQAQLGNIPGGSSEPYDDGTFQGLKIVAQDIPIRQVSSVSGGQGNVSIVQDGDEFTFLMTGDLTGMMGQQLPPGMAGGAQATVSVTFPGKVVSSNGTVDGRTVTWDLLALTTDRLEAVGKATAASAMAGTWLVWVMVGLLVVAAVVVAVVLLRRRQTPAVQTHTMMSAPAASVGGFGLNTGPGPVPAHGPGPGGPGHSPGHPPTPGGYGPGLAPMSPNDRFQPPSPSSTPGSS